MNASDLLRRLERDTLAALGALSVAAVLWRPNRPSLALGILGGGALVALAYWAIRGIADGLVARAITAGIPRKSRAGALVKFFTRHAILAFVGYVMMARLEFDALGLLIGVSTPAVAAGVESVRALRR